MLQATYVRPDRITRTSVLEPTAEGYQPVRAAQGVAAQFTRIYGPTVWGGGGFGGGDNVVMTSQGPMAPEAPIRVEDTAQATAAVAQSFAQGKSVRISDKYGRSIIAHPTGEQQRFPFWSMLVNRARAMVAAMFGREATPVPQYRSQTQPPRPGAIPVAYGWAPAFNREGQAAQKILPPGAKPPQSAYLPARAGAVREAPKALTAEMLASKTPTGVPNMVRVRGQANALDWFHREGRYY
jgi:hypothetical protein